MSEEDNNREDEGLEESSELAALVDLIDARRKPKEFPDIEPIDLNDVSEKLHAEDTLRFIRKLETVEIQYISIMVAKSTLNLILSAMGLRIFP